MSNENDSDGAPVRPGASSEPVSPVTVVKLVVFTALVPVTVAIAVPRALLSRRPYPTLPIPRPLGKLSGAVTGLLGVLVYLHTAGRFLLEGRGTPSPTDEPETLVTGGLYEHVRNPMYLGVLLVIVGQGLWYRSVSILWWGAGCWIGFHNRVLSYEEPHLREKHGEAFEEYLEDVPRWLPKR